MSTNSSTISRICVDTHPFIWYCLGKTTLSVKAKQLIDHGFSKKVLLVIPTTVVLETFHVSLKDPTFDFPVFLKALRRARAILAPFDKTVLQACYRFPIDVDIHDRVIAATALVHRCPLITKDERLRELQIIETVW